MKTNYHTPSREPPPGGLAWQQPPGMREAGGQTKTFSQINIQIYKSETIDMKKEKAKYKQQDDRLLKRLSRPDRQRQERLRKQIQSDPMFFAV